MFGEREINIVRDNHNYFKEDYAKIMEGLGIDWYAELQCLSVSEGWTSFRDKCLDVIQRHAPSYITNNKGKSKPMQFNNKRIKLAGGKNYH